MKFFTSYIFLFLNNYRPTVSWHVQSLFSKFPPTHTGFPLRTPGGSWQVRVLFWSQYGCASEHFVQSDHSDHCPCTENKQMN